MDSKHRWFTGGIHHESNTDCCCGCHCNKVFKKVAVRLNRGPSSVPLSLDSDEFNDFDGEIKISPLQRRPNQSENENCLCSSCCNCIQMNENGVDIREKEIPHVSLFYAPPTFLRELCGVTAFAGCSGLAKGYSFTGSGEYTLLSNSPFSTSTGTSSCRRVSIDECKCHGLWVGFFNEVLGAYADRYEDIV